MRVYKPCTSPASESEFGHATRIPLLYQGYLSIGYSFYGRFMGPFVVAKQTAQLLCPLTRKTLREYNSDTPKTTRDTLTFFNCTWSHLKLLSASDRNHPNKPIVGVH